MTFGLAAAGALITSAAATACSAEGDGRTPSSHSPSNSSEAQLGPSTTTPAPPGAPGEPSSAGAPGEPSSPGSPPAETGSQATSTETSAPAPIAQNSNSGDPADGNPATVDSTAEPSDSSVGRPIDSESTSNPDAEVGPDGGSSVASETPAPLPSPDAGMRPLSFAADIWPIYEMAREPPFVYPGGTTYGSCVVGGVCHGGERPGAGLRMPDAQTAYEMLLEVPSQSSLCEGTLRVVAEHPEESCLILFYEGRLHDELDWVDEAEIDLMRQWITQGAHP